MKVLIINSMSGRGSTGRIIDGIADVLKSRGDDVKIIYGLEQSNHPCAIKVGSKIEQTLHKCLSHALDMQGLGSIFATKRIVSLIREFKPDVINIHTIHGNYLNYPILFRYLENANTKIVWTLHDCWTFTGHCPHFIFEGCYKWKHEGCHNCPQLWMYPKSDLIDGSRRNFRLKKKYFTRISNKLIIIAVSEWLASLTRESFFKNTPIKVIHNGIDLNEFKIVRKTSQIRKKYKIPNKKIILGVASPWHFRKGYDDIFKLRDLLSIEQYEIILVGVSQKQCESLPDGIIGILRTENIDELATLYSIADVFINPTYEDCFPTVNLESIACGTPIVTYRTGGCPEAITPITGKVVDQGDISSMADAIKEIVQLKETVFTAESCREHAIKNFGKENAFMHYADLFHHFEHN